MKKEFYFLLISVFFSFNLLIAQNMGLDFNGSIDYAIIADNNARDI